MNGDNLPCLALPCLALPCLALPCLALPCLALPCLALPCLALPCLALPCLALPCLALPCLALPCLALPCLALPCLALPCLALPCLAYTVVSVDRWGITDDLATSSLHSSRLSAFLMAAPSVKPVHSGMLSSHLFLCLPLLCLPRYVAVPSKFSLFDCGQEVYVGSNGLPSSVSYLFVGDVVSVRDAEEFSEASHLHGLYPLLGFCC